MTASVAAPVTRERIAAAIRWQLTARGLAATAALTAAWCALWGSPSAANVLSGLVVASVVSLAGARTQGSVRLGPLCRLVWIVVVDLAVSTAVVVREVLTPTDYTDEAIVAIPIPAAGRDHLLLFYVAITVTPGTAVVAAEADASIVYLHVLHADRVDEVQRHVELLFAVADRAFPASGVPATIEEPM